MKEQLSSRFMVYLVALSSAVGLGNLWKFPTLTGENGGAAFVFIYILSTFIVGIPLLICEFTMGRSTKSDVSTVFTKLRAHKAWNIVSWISILANFLILVFYTVIVGWVYTYLLKAIKGQLSNPSPEALDATFSSMTNSYGSFIAQAFVIIVVGFILYKGIAKGIEAALRILSPIFLVLLMIVFFNSIRLDGFGEAMNFLFKFDLSAITPAVIVSALGLAFFKLSIGSAAMITYGSYFTKDTDIPKTAVTVAFADVVVSLLAGMALFPVVFTFGLQPTQGAGLLFNTVPLAFANLPGGNIFTIAFFALAAIIGTTATVALLQVQYAVICEKVSGSKLFKVALLGGILLGISFLTMFPFSVFGNITFAGEVLFDFVDTVSSDYLLPLAGLFIAIFVGWIMKHTIIHDELGNNKIIRAWLFTVRYIVPIIVVLVFLNGIGIIKF
ncbi:MAG: sodium-dependent transporter [Bacillaceae bacterium]